MPACCCVSSTARLTGAHLSLTAEFFANGSWEGPAAGCHGGRSERARPEGPRGAGADPSPPSPGPGLTRRLHPCPAVPGMLV